MTTASETRTGASTPWLVVALASFLCVLLAAGEAVRVLAGLRAAYVPFDRTTLDALVFVHYRLPLASPAWHTMLLALAVWSIALVILLAALSRAQTPRLSKALVVAQAVLLATFALTVMPIDSDQFYYAGEASLVLRGANPYVPPASTNNAPIGEQRIAAHWGSPLPPDPYGPVWTIANAVLLWPFQHMSVETQTLVLRLAASAAAIACALMLSTLAGSGQRGAVATAAFALNPIVVLDAGSGAHNDVFMLVAALGAALSLQWRRPVLAAFLLGVSVGIKFAYAPLLLPLLAYVWVNSRELRTVALSALAFFAPLFVAAAPFGIRNALIAPIFLLKSGPAAVAQVAARVVHHIPGLHSASARPFDTMLGLAILALAVVATWRILAGRSAFAPLLWLFVAIWLFAGKGEPWYALSLTPLLIGGSRAGVSLFVGATCACIFMVAGSFRNEFPYGAMYISAFLLTLITFALLKIPESTTTKKAEPPGLAQVSPARFA